MRTKYSIYNTVSGMISQIIIVVIGFISRKIFVSALGIEMQGVNAALTSIISMLSLTELGIGTAIIVNLYRPLADGDHNTVNALLQLYSKVYTVIAVIIALVGLAVIPFLSNIINDYDVQASYLTKAFLLFLLDAVISYLFAYKRSILTADQKNYIINIIRTIVNVFMYTAQIVILLATSDYLLFLAIKAGFRFIENLVVAWIANRRYPYIKTKNKYKVEERTRSNIIDNTKSLSLHYLGNYLVNGASPLIVSGVLGAVMAGIYSNYTLITTTVKEVSAQFGAGITPSFGNLIAAGEEHRLYGAFKKTMFAAFLIANIVCVTLIAVFNDVILLWFGNSEYILQMASVVMLCVNLYMIILSEPMGSLRASAGLFRQDRYLHIMLAALNLVVSFLLTRFFGIIGVFIGTFICQLIKEFTVLPLIVCKNLLHIKLSKYQLRFVTYAAVTIVGVITSYFLCTFIVLDSLLLTIVLKILICVAISTLLAFACFYKTEEFIYCKMTIGNLIRKVFKKEKQLEK